MIRSLMGLLIIAVIFLAGMVVGIGKEEQTSISDTAELMDHDSLQEEEIKEEKSEYPEAEEAMSEADTPNHLTQKMASSLESIVKGFYEMVVQLCYAFANLFF